MIAKIPFDADQSKTNTEAMVRVLLLSLEISLIYRSKNELMTFGVKLSVTPTKVSAEEPMCVNAAKIKITNGISDKNIKKAVCAEYAPIRPA